MSKMRSSKNSRVKKNLSQFITRKISSCCYSVSRISDGPGVKAQKYFEDNRGRPQIWQDLQTNPVTQ